MRKKILLVEDNPDLLEVLRLGISEAGFSVSTAGNGLEALEKARSESPALIVLDLILPELDGFAVCESLRRHRETAAIPIIVVTGLSSELARYAVFEAGANEFVTKPITPSRLVSRIRHCLGHPRRRARRRQAAAAAAE